MPLISYEYCIPYIIIIGICFLFAYTLHTKRERTYGYIIIIGILIIFFGLRGYISTDYISYKPFFEGLDEIYNLNLYGHTIEIGYIIYTSVQKVLISNYFVWVFVNSIIQLLIIQHIFIKYSRNVFLSWALFITFGGLSIEINLYRNIISLCLFFISIKYLLNRNFTRYLILNILGFLFHSSSLIYIPLYFFVYKKFKQNVYYIIFIAINIIYLFNYFPTSIVLNKFFGESESHIALKLMGYYDNSENALGFSFGYIEKTLTYLLSIYIIRRLEKENFLKLFFYNSFVIYYCISLIFADVYVIAERLSYLFIYSYWFVYPDIIGKLKGNNKKFGIIILLLLCILKTSIITKKVFWKYDNIIFGIESFEVRSQRYYNNKDL